MYVEDCIGESTTKLAGVAKNVFRHSLGLYSLNVLHLGGMLNAKIARMRRED